MSKILLITNIYPPQIGGPSTFINQFARFLAGKGHRVTVVCVSEKKHPELDNKENFLVKRITPGRLKIQFHIRKWGILTRYILTNNKILVNGLEAESSAVCTFFKKKYILKIVGDWAWEYARNNSLTHLNIDEFQNQHQLLPAILAVRRIRNSNVKNASLVYVPSNYLKKIVEGWGKESDKIIVINNGVALEDVSDNNLSGSDNNLLNIIFIGRITNWKGIDLLLLAIKDVTGVEVKICGDGPELTASIELNKKLKNTNVTFLGKVPAVEVKSYIQKADVLVLPSLYEGLSHTVLEAMAYGVPAIISNVGGNPELVNHGYNGLLFDPYDYIQLRDCIIKLRDSRNYLAELSSNCYKFVEDFDKFITYKQVEELICTKQ